MHAFSLRDKSIVRELAERTAEIAALPVQEETRRLWRSLNGLRPDRPMIMIDQLPWHELEADESLAVRCQDEFCRGIERELRRNLYKWEHLRADMVIEPFIVAPKVIRGTGFGIEILEDTAVTDPRNDVVGHSYLDQLRSEADLEKIQTPDPVLDRPATAALEERARELLDGILEVRMQGVLPRFTLWDRLVEWRGAQSLLIDLIDRPEFMHKLMSRLTEASLTLLDRLEERGLLGWGQTAIHCTGAYSDELPAPGFDPARPRAGDLWTCGMAQIFATVSPSMHAEFEIEYAAGWYARFGLAYYGCCEPLHDKIDLVRRLARVRKISMSPWAQVEKGAERIGRDYVFSSKPSPALLAGPGWEPEAVKGELGRTMAACRRNGCPVEFILKDVSTLGYRPERLWEWAQIAAGLVRG